MKNRTQFTRGYKTATAWLAIDENFDSIELAADDMPREITEDGEGFYIANSQLIADWCAEHSQTYEEAGALFYFTRNGHGAGYWEFGGKLSDQLTDNARKWGACTVMLTEPGNYTVCH